MSALPTDLGTLGTLELFPAVVGLDVNPEGFLAVEQLVAHRAYKLTYMVFNCSINIVIFKYILDSGPVSVYTGLTRIVDNNINNIIHDMIF